MEPQDAVKLCYQAAFGAEHLLRDEESAYRYLKEEYDAVEADDSPLYEMIHPNVCRVNLSAWKREGLPLEWLSRMFAATAGNPPKNGGESFADCLLEVEDLLKENCFAFDRKRWEAFLSDYPVQEPKAVHHSESYRQKEHPAYRLVCSRFIRLFPLLQAIAGLPEGMRIVAIDGRCASGKTTLARQLEEIAGAGVVHMDDFFLPPELRTEERLSEPGGNVHYERVKEEVLSRIGNRKAFSYDRFDCSRMAMGEKRRVPEGLLRVVEGAYSCHPALGEYMQLKVFCNVESGEQLSRIEQRDGREMLESFRSRWIPMEEKYFRHFHIEENVNLTV